MKSELQELARKNAEVRVIIVNGFQIVGRIMDADESAVVIDVNGSRKVINVNAVSTVEPLKCSPKVGQKLCGKAILNSVLDRT